MEASAAIGSIFIIFSSSDAVPIEVSFLEKGISLLSITQTTPIILFVRFRSSLPFLNALSCSAKAFLFGRISSGESLQENLFRRLFRSVSSGESPQLRRSDLVALNERYRRARRAETAGCKILLSTGQLEDAARFKSL